MAILRALPLLLAAGCAQTLGFEDCNTDDDCNHAAPDGGGGGAKLYCTSDHLCVAGVPDERLCPDVVGTPGSGSLVIGVLTDRTLYDKMKPVVFQDHLIELAAKMAIQEINQRQSGASQPPLVAYFCDTASDDVQTVKAAKHVVLQNGAAAIIGPTTSGNVVALNSFAKSSGTLVISPSATSVDITQLQDDNLVWRIAPSDALQAKVLAQKVKDSVTMGMGQPKVETMHVSTVYGTGFDNTFIMAYGQLGGPGFSRSYPFSPGATTDIDDTLNQLNKDGVTHLVIAADNDDPYITSKLASQMFLAMNTQFFLTDAAKTPDLLAGVDANILSRLHGTAPATPTSATYMTFRTAFIGANASDPSQVAFVANGYDAAYLIAVAAAATTGHVPTGKDLAVGLGRLKTMGTPVPVGPTSYLDALKQMAMGGVLLEGASGPLVFDSFGDPVNGQYQFWCVDMSGMFIDCP